MRKLNINWKQTFLVVFDVLLAAYLFMAMTSWNTPRRITPLCTKVDIMIADESVNGFLNNTEVKSLLEKHGLYPLSKAVADINPRLIENELRHMPFVKTAQCYITDDSHVCITITQRTPVVRVKADNGDDYYIDDAGGVMPNSQYTSDMIIVTGSVSQRFACRTIFPMARTLMEDDKWRNLVEQINVLPDRTIEIVPRIGEHIVCLGQLPDDPDLKTRQQNISAFVNKQMHRLELFYKEGLRFAVWNKYDYITLQNHNQIVCHRRERQTNDHIID